MIKIGLGYGDGHTILKINAGPLKSLILRDTTEYLISLVTSKNDGSQFIALDRFEWTVLGVTHYFDLFPDDSQSERIVMFVFLAGLLRHLNENFDNTLDDEALTEIISSFSCEFFEGMEPKVVIREPGKGATE